MDLFSSEAVFAVMEKEEQHLIRESCLSIMTLSVNILNHLNGNCSAGT